MMTALMQLCYDGDVKGLRALWKQSKKDLNMAIAFSNEGAPGYSSVYPIHVAAYTGSLEVVRFLLVEAKCDIHALTLNTNKTALHVSARPSPQHVEVLKLLIQRGAEVDRRDGLGNTALHYACGCGNNDAILLLHSHGASVTIRDLSFRTPLMKAVYSNRVDTVRVLLTLGVEVDCQNETGNTALHVAVQFEKKQVIEALLTAGITADTLNRDGYSAFLLSVRLGNIAVTRELLRQGCSPNVRNPLDGNSALHLAYQYGEGEMAQMLLAHGCQQDCYNNLYESPVYRVVLNNRINTVKYLAIANYDFDIPALLPSDQNDVEEPLSLYKVALSNGCINICCMLYFVNCDVLTADLFLSLKDDVQSRMEFDERYFMLRNIPSLKCLARKRVRKSLNWNIAIAIESLHLPPSVKDYVILADNNMCM